MVKPVSGLTTALIMLGFFAITVLMVGTTVWALSS